MSNIVLYAIPAFVILITLEAYLAWKKQQAVYETKDTFACLAMGLGNVIISAGAKLLTFALMLLIWTHLRVFDIPQTGIALWWVIPLLIVCEDFCYYWFHRLHHETRIGWAAHVNHHSSQRYNLAVALRQSWTTPLTGFVFWLPLAIIGFHPVLILFAQAISLLYQFWIHTQAINRLGPLEWIFNTPSHHRVHHGANPEYIDKNYAGILIIWDRLFGSFAPEQAPVQYGLTKNINSYNPLTIAFHEWQTMARDARQAMGWKNKLGYLLRRPGWQPSVHYPTSNQARTTKPATELVSEPNTIKLSKPNANHAVNESVKNAVNQ